MSSKKLKRTRKDRTADDVTANTSGKVEEEDEESDAGGGEHDEDAPVTPRETRARAAGLPPPSASMPTTPSAAHGRAHHHYSPGWECTVCTYRNSYRNRTEAFKCEMCDTRKGTSTRKPRLNANMIDQQQVMQNFVIQQQQQQQNNGSPPTSVSGGDATSTATADAPLCLRKASSVTPTRPHTAAVLFRHTSGSPNNSRRPRELSSPPDSISSPCSSKTATPRTTPPPVGGCSGGGKQKKTARNVSPSSAAVPSDDAFVFAFGRQVDKSLARTLTVTVDGITVVVTDYKVAAEADDDGEGTMTASSKKANRKKKAATPRLKDQAHHAHGGGKAVKALTLTMPRVAESGPASATVGRTFDEEKTAS